VQFLGFRFQCRQAAEGCATAILLSAKAERRLRTTVREMTPPARGRSLAACMEELSRYLNGDQLRTASRQYRIVRDPMVLPASPL
jgi:hypothetical protein